MNKVYGQKTTEQKWYQFWEENGFFRPDPSSTKTPYSLLMPPPNLTGEPHAGHTLQHLIMDAIARFKRMQGFDVLFLPGVDHAGIQFESTFNKLLAKEDLSKEKLGREKWLERAWQFKTRVYQSFHKTWRLLGISADWSREVFTLEPKVQKAVLEEFKSFWQQDLLYKGAYIVQWCSKDQTAIEDLEMEYEERKEKLYYVRYKIDGIDGVEGEYITVATARPETIAADVAIAIYPNHPKFAKFLNKNAINPFTKTKILIIEDSRVDKEFGTGALKITPGHDLLDYQIGQDHHLAILHVISKDGLITELDPNLAGLKVLEAREKAAQILQEKGALEKVEDYTHSVPVCERCKTVIEPLISEEWFVKMTPLAQKALKNIAKINFIPKKYLKNLSLWLAQIHDWCISRPLWWGHQIPVWYCQKCNPNHEVGKDKDMIISLEKPGKNCQTCGEKHWIQEEKILDTWFSSGLWPMATLGWPSSAQSTAGKPARNIELARYYPWDLEVTAREIRYLWIARMIMLGLWFMDNIPFENMFFHGMLRPTKGPKFSKSLGNAVYPAELTKLWGTDATRMTLYSYTAPDRDGRTSRQILNERAKNYRNFSTKLKNIFRFIIEMKPKNSINKKATVLDKMDHSDDHWILEELKKTVKIVTKELDSFELHLAAEELYDFIWHKFADVYIEKTKTRRVESQPVLEYVFKTSLELLHPFMPFITEELWQKLVLSNAEGLLHEGKSIMITKWPEMK